MNKTRNLYEPSVRIWCYQLDGSKCIWSTDRLCFHWIMKCRLYRSNSNTGFE